MGADGRFQGADALGMRDDGIFHVADAVGMAAEDRFHDADALGMRDDGIFHVAVGLGMADAVFGSRAAGRSPWSFAAQAAAAA
jgi:hypothetical protein